MVLGSVSCLWHRGGRLIVLNRSYTVNIKEVFLLYPFAVYEGI